MKKQSCACRLSSAKPRTQLAFLCSALAGAVLCNSALAAGSIGLSFTSATSENLTAAELAGAPDFAQTNWNNGGGTGTGVAVIDASGVSSGVKISWSANNTWGTGISTATPNGKLMRGYLDSTGTANDNSSPYSLAINANRPDVFVDGLSAWMTAQGALSYDVVVYFDGDASSGRIGEYWLQQSTAKDANGLPIALGSDLTPHAFGADTTNFNGTFVQVPLTANNSQNAASGNYIVFPGVNSDNFILRTEEHYERALINGIQIVPRLALAAPVIAVSPANQVKYVGGQVIFSVAASGSGPLHYQWVKASVGNLLNATNSTLTISNLSAADSGSQYYVLVSNSASFAPSEYATLTVMDAPPANYFASVVLTNKPISYLRFGGEDAIIYDYAGSHNGVSGASAFSTDYYLNPNSFMGFEPGNPQWQFNSSAMDGSVAMPSLINVKTNAMTFIAWVLPVGPNGSGQQASWSGIVMTRNGTSSGLTYTDGKNELGYLWNGYWSFRSGLTVPDSEWSMVAMVVDPAKVTLYVLNAEGVKSSVSAQANAAASFVGDFWIGTDPGFRTTRGFNGSMDEVAVFDRSLGTSDIMNLYQAAIGGSTPAPIISQQPICEQVYTGKTAHLAVVAVGGGTVTYQWKNAAGAVVNSARISGAQTPFLTISNAAASDIGSYYVEVKNQGGTTVSSTVTLNVVNPTGQTYETAVNAAGPYAYWRFSETSGTNAFDNIGGFTGVFGGSAALGAAGPSSPTFSGFGSGNTAFQSAVNVASSYVSIPGLNLNTNTVTIAGWVYSAGAQAGSAGMIFSRSGDTISGICNCNGQLSYTWNDNWNWQSGFVIPTDQWTFIALSVQTNQGTIYMATNGVMQKAVRVMNHPVQSFSGITCIGTDTFGDSRTFNGSIDEVVVFKRSLSDAEITDLYSKGVGQGIVPQITFLTPTSLGGWSGYNANFTASVLGSSTLSYQWYKGTTPVVDGGNISGATTVSLSISNVTAANAGAYTLVVASTSANSSTSSVCSVTVGVPPSVPYHTTVLAANPAGYWRLNETNGTIAHDLTGLHDGTYGSAVKLGGAAEENQGLYGFGKDAASARFTRVTDQSWVTLPALNLNTNAVTIMAWVYPNVRPDNWAGIFVQQSTRDGLVFRDNTPNVLGYYWNGRDFWYYGNPMTVPIGQWSLVAASVEATNATIYVMNSTGTTSFNYPYNMNVNAWSGTTAIGADTSDATPANWKNYVFDGSINNVAVFTRTLTASDLQQFYSAGTTAQLAPVTLDIQRTADGVQLTWPRGVLYESESVSGTWTAIPAAISPYPVSATATNKFYRVISSN